MGISLNDVQRGYDRWAAKPHNAKWVRKIDGTPIPNDIVVNIFEALKDDPGSGGDGEDNQPRYTTKRLRVEIAKAKAYARREALEEAAKAAETAQISGSLVRPGVAAAIRALIPREG
ncbi:hypothetical protein ELI20_21080 [Rhizobium ruizarguesonis]|uniref:hypothetical protein n=1 Tax=Rhizobium ruizarguesonis TaxID=2081791 RepID=UPI0010320CB3|nr:hypothetical protein [Rhizobium ruizarguesonis]TAU33346.1 hypothetical protein ELI47_20760 [Rhizobium ruizarguesonis]TAW23531.1 hypothetical protein ELI20_21080 [Rhizobium ruizarguesonis]